MRLHATALHYFDTVRRAGSIREAARRLNIASSAVNRQILKLEEDIGLDLFERLPRGVRLTAAGEALARHVIVIRQDFERFGSDIAALKGLQVGAVTVAAPEGLCSQVLPEVLTRLAKIAPGISVNVRRIGSLTVPQAVLDDSCDVGLAFDAAGDSRLKTVWQSQRPIGAIVAPTHPIARHPTITLNDCLDHMLLLPEYDLTIELMLRPALSALRKDVKSVLRSNSIELLRAMAERGAGIAFQTRYGLDKPLEDGSLRYIPLRAPGPLMSTLAVLVRTRRALPLAVAMFLDVLRAALDETRDDAVSASD